MSGLGLVLAHSSALLVLPDCRSRPAHGRRVESMASVRAGAVCLEDVSAVIRHRQAERAAVGLTSLKSAGEN